MLTRHDQVVSGLAASNFVAELNGKPAQVESSVRDPLRHRLVILVDHSGSMSGLRWHIAREATLALLNRLPTQIPVQVIAQGDFDVGARHRNALCFRSRRASSARPRFRRDFTVPSGTFNT